MLEAIREVISLNPQASQEEISSAVIGYLQSTVADAIRDISLPPQQSPVKAALERYRAQRYKIPRRRSVGTRNALVEELYGLKFSLNGHGYLANTSEEVKKWNGGAFSDRVTPGLEARLSGGQSVTLTPTRLGPGTADRILRKQQRPSPYFSLPEAQNRTFRLTYRDSFADRLSNPAFEEISRALEERLRDFSERTGLDWDFKISEESDIELPGWKRFVLRIGIAAADFEQRLELWDKLDVEIRQLLTKLSQDHPEDSGKIRDFGRSLFLRMDTA